MPVPLRPKNTSSQCYRVNDMFKPENTSAQCYRVNDMYKPKLTLLECSTCRKFYKSEASLKKHLKMHLPGYKKPKPRTAEELAEICKFQCATCGKQFIRKCGLKRHMIVHEVIRRCEACGNTCKDSHAHCKHKRKCKAYIELKKTRAKAGNQTSNTTRWIETTEEYLSVYQHKCQMCQARFAFREHLDTHTEHCGDAFWTENKEDQLKLLYERIVNNNAKRIRKEIFLKVVKKNRKRPRYDSNGHKRIKAEHLTRIRKSIFHSSAMGVVSSKIKHKYNNAQKMMGKKLKERKKALAKFKRKVKQRLFRSRQIIERDTWYKCTLCGSFGRAETIVHHLKSPIHNLQMPVICGACTKGFQTLQDFRFHQALHKHKITNHTLMIRYTANVHTDETKQVLSRNEKVKNSSSVKLKSDVKKIMVSKSKSITVHQFESKCLCGIEFRDVKKMTIHVSSSHNLILAFKCKYCITDNIFHNIGDFLKHLTSQHKRRKGQMFQSDFETKFLLPIGSEGTNVLVSEEQSSSTTALLDKRHETQIKDEENIKQEQSDELTESQLIAKQEEFVKLALRQMIPERIGSKTLDGKVRKPEMRKRPLLIEKNTANAKELSAAKKRRIEREQMMEKYQETAMKIRAKQCLRKYKSILGWKFKKNHRQSRCKFSVRNGQRVEKSRFMVNQTNRKVSEETKAVLSGSFPSQCHLCKKLFQSQAVLLSHIRNIHNLVFGYKCRSCDPPIVFMQLQEFYNHIKNVHGKYNLSKDEVEQVTVIKLENSGQVSTNSKTDIALSQTSTSVSPGVPYKLVDLKAAQAHAHSDNQTTQSTTKRRQIRPKYDPDFEYGQEVTVLSERQKLEELLQKNVTIPDQHWKEVTIMIKGEPVETVNERKTSRDEHICRVCRKRFRLKIMLNQHLKKIHKISPSVNRETQQEKMPLKGEIKLKRNVESHLKDVNLKQNNIAQFVRVSENAMYMSSVYQSRPEKKDSEVNSVNTKKKTGGTKKASQDDHNYVARNRKQESNDSTLLQCPSKNCDYKCKTASTLKRHMTVKHSNETNLYVPTPITKSVEPSDSRKYFEEDIDSGDSDLGDMVDTDDSDYKAESDLGDMTDHGDIADITDQNDSDYKVESETDVEGKSKSKLKTIENNQKHSHSVLENEVNKISSILGKFSKSLCKPSTHKYYCPFCAEVKYSPTYEEIRDHIDKVHSETTLQQTGENSDSTKAKSSGQTVVMVEALGTIPEKSDNCPEPQSEAIGSTLPEMETEADKGDPHSVSSGPVGGSDVVPDYLGARNDDGLAEKQVCFHKFFYELLMRKTYFQGFQSLYSHLLLTGLLGTCTPFRSLTFGQRNKIHSINNAINQMH